MIARLLKFPGQPRSQKNMEGSARVRSISSKISLSSQEREFLPELLEIQETPPPAYQRALVWSLGGAVTLILLWSTIGSLDVVSTASGRFIPDGRVKIVQVTDTAIVRAIHVKEGQQVKQGDLLLELDPTLVAADLTSGTQNLSQNRLDAARLSAELSGQDAHYQQSERVTEAERLQVALEESLRSANEAAYESKLSSTRSVEAEKRAALAAAEITQRKLLVLRDVAQERNTDAKALVDEHFLSRVEYLKDYQDWVSADQDAAAQVKTVEQAQQAVREAQQQVQLVQQTRRADILKDLNQNAANRPDLESHFDKARQLHALKWLRAPVSGYVQAVAVTTTGGVVTPAENLVTIVPEGTPLIVEAQLSNDDIGYVQIGEPVEIKIDTYPFQKYGSLKGTVTWISPDAEQPSDNKSPASGDFNGAAESERSSKGLTYRLHIAPLAGASIQTNGHAAALKPGMSVQADVLTDKRKIYEFFLSPLVKYLDEGTHVR